MTTAAPPPAAPPGSADERLPRWRPDLEVVEEARAALAPRYFVRDPVTDVVHALEEEAFFLCRQLDGRTDATDVLRRYADEFGAELSPADLAAFVRQLDQNGLLEDGAGPRKTWPELLDGPELVPVVRLRLLHADPLFTWLAPRVAWLFRRPAQIAMASVYALGLVVLVTSAGELLHAYGAHASIGFLLGAVGFSLTIVHVLRALAHGVMAKRYGRQVLDVGLSLAYRVVPFAYCDWSDAIWLWRKSERLWCIFAGIWVQLLVWALAIVGWRMTQDGTTLNALCLAASFGAAFGLLFFNGNPLVEMDAYLLVSFWLEVPRMRRRALAAFGEWLYRWPPREVTTRRTRRWLVAYGGLCAVYVLAHLGLLLWVVGVHFAFGGAGAMGTVMLGTFLFQRPIGFYLRELPPVRWYRERAERTPRRVWWLTVALVVLLVGLVPYPYETGGPLVLLPLDRTEIHAQVEGQVQSVWVKEGDRVVPDQALAQLESWQYETQLTAAREQMNAKEADLRLLRAGPKSEEVARARSAVQVAAEEVGKATQQLEAAKTRLRYASAHAERYDALHRDGAISRQDYENAQRERDMDQGQVDVQNAQLMVARKTLQAAEASLTLVESGARPEQLEAAAAEIERLRAVVAGLEEQLRLTLVRSTVEGVVSTPYVDQKVGQYLKKGDLFAVIETAKTIQAETRVPEEDASDAVRDARVKVVVWTFPSRTFYGRVLFVAPVATIESPGQPWKAVRVLTEIPNDDGLLKPAMTGYAKIATGWRPLWKVFLWPLIRWFMVQVWYWLP